MSPSLAAITASPSPAFPSRCEKVAAKPSDGERPRAYSCAALVILLLSIATPLLASKPIAVTPADAATIKKDIAAQRAHVVVVNFWATWCEPCVAEFPALVALEKKYRGDGLVVFAVSADQRKDIGSKVAPFLRKQHAYFPQYLQQSKDPEVFIDAFDPKWQGDLPKTFIYDKSGRLVKELSNEQTLRSFTAAVKPLLVH